jgi:glyoxylase-like metal-dependent hydrolase (beta-lactamase superfamily II)
MEHMDDPIVIDTNMHGIPGLTGAFVVKGDRTALVETGPLSSLHEVLRALAESGVDRLDVIVVTHVHLDHAGAAGALVRHFPDAMVVVHEIGAPHLVDPSKLWSSASRIYGAKMSVLWGGIDPIAEDRIRAVADDDVVDLGGRSLRALATPGHASHHHAYLDDATGIVFAGDALGVRLPDVGVVRPATPPPEFDIEATIASIERIKALDPSSVWLTHFGPAERGIHAGDAATICDAAIAALRAWERWVASARRETRDLDDAAGLVEREARATLESALAPAQIERLEQTSSYWMNTWGYMRYFDRKER